MADTGIFATTAEVQRKVGASASTTANAEAYINDFMVQAENLINVTCTFDFSAAYSGLTAQVKSILKAAASAWAAMRVINYDVDSIGRSSATLRLNVLKDEYNTAMAELKVKNTQDFINNDT